MTVGAGDSSIAVFELYWNPVSVWSPLATDRKRDRHRGRCCPAASDTVTVALAAFASTVSGVPPITPVAVSMFSPGGRPVAPYSAMPLPLDGLIALIATPTCSEPGAV